MVEQNLVGVVVVPYLNQQIVEVLLLLVESDGHSEQVLELGDEVMEEDYYFNKHGTIFEYSIFFKLLMLRKLF